MREQPLDDFLARSDVHDGSCRWMRRSGAPGGHVRCRSSRRTPACCRSSGAAQRDARESLPAEAGARRRAAIRSPDALHRAPRRKQARREAVPRRSARRTASRAPRCRLGRKSPPLRSATTPTLRGNTAVRCRETVAGRLRTIDRAASSAAGAPFLRCHPVPSERRRRRYRPDRTDRIRDHPGIEAPNQVSRRIPGDGIGRRRRRAKAARRRRIQMRSSMSSPDRWRNLSTRESFGNYQSW